MEVNLKEKHRCYKKKHEEILNIFAEVFVNKEFMYIQNYIL